MTYSIYSVTTELLTGGFDAIDRILAKGSTFCHENGMTDEELLQARLHATMYPAIKQIQIATDNAKAGMFRMTGGEPPRWEDVETTLPEIKARIQRARDIIASKTEADFAGAETRSVTGRFGDTVRTFTGASYLQGFLIPNFSFHVTTLYGIYRSKGVPLVKADILGW
jgi:uncharacterized protein